MPIEGSAVLAACAAIPAKAYLTEIGKLAAQDTYGAFKNQLAKFSDWSSDYNANFLYSLRYIASKQKISPLQEENAQSLVIENPMDIRITTNKASGERIKRLNDIYDFWRNYERAKKRYETADDFLVSCSPLDKNALFERLKQSGGWKAIVHAPGGFGKTTLFLGIAELALRDKEVIPIYFDLARQSDQIQEHTVREFIENYSIVPGTSLENYVEIIAFAEALGRTVIILIDGLNQESRIKWDDLRSSILSLTHGFPTNRISILIADRMNERNIEEQNFRISTISPLARGFIEDRLAYNPTLRDLVTKPGWNEILDTPLFLEPAEKSFKEGNLPSRTALIENYLDTTISYQIDGNKVSIFPDIADGSLGRSAYYFYEEAQHTEIERDRFRDLLNDEALYSALKQSGAISLRENVVDGTQMVSFFHQTIHDFLVARYLTKIEPQKSLTEWSNKAFDIVSLNQSSYDALELASEHIAQLTDEDPRKKLSDQFLLQAYDWSLKGTLRIIARLHQLGRNDILSKPLLWALYAVNLEKKFDSFEHSVASAREYFEEILPIEANDAWKKINTNLNQLIEFIKTMKHLFQFVVKNTGTIGCPYLEEKRKKQALKTWHIFPRTHCLDGRPLTYLGDLIAPQKTKVSGNRFVFFI